MASRVTTGRRGRLVLLALLGAISAVAVVELLKPAGATGNTISIVGPEQLGLGLQDSFDVALSDPAPAGDLQVTVASADANCTVSTSAYGVGSASTDVSVKRNHVRKSFVIQSVGAATGSCTISVSTGTSGWTGSSLVLPIVQPRLRLRELPHRIGIQAPSHGFFVETGVPNASTHGLRYVQGASMRSPAVDIQVTVCSSNAAVGTITDVYGNDGGNDGCETNPVHAPYSRTVPGAYRFAPKSGAASVDVTANATGFLSDTRSVSVSALSARIDGPEEIGTGLQENYTIVLNSAVDSQLPVTISTSPTSACQVAASSLSLADTSIVRNVAAGRSRTDFVVQGLATTVPGSPCVVTINAGSSYGSDSLEIDIVQPALRLRDLPTSIGAQDKRNGFYVETGVPGNRPGTLRHVQEWRKGTVSEAPRSPLSVTATSDAPAVGTIVDRYGIDNGNDGSEATDVGLGHSRTVPDAVAFDPESGSDVDVKVSVAASGFLGDEQFVHVRGTGFRLSGYAQLGVGLQDDYKVQITGTNPSTSVPVRITSHQPTVCGVMSTSNGTPADHVDLSIPFYKQSTDFVVQASATAVPGETCEIEATSTTSGFDPDTFTVTITDAGIEITGLRHNMSNTAPNAGFVVGVGVPNPSNTAVRHPQRVGKGVGNAEFKVCSTKPSVGVIVDVVNTDNPAAFDDPAGQSCEDHYIPETYPNNVPNWLKFDPIGPGDTIVEIYSAPGFRVMDRSGHIPVHVGGDSVRLDLPNAVGSGLQVEVTVKLSRLAGTGGVNVGISKSADSDCLLAPDSATAGGDGPLAVTVTAGSDEASFVVAGKDYVDDGNCHLTATATNFISDEDDLRVVHHGLSIQDIERRTVINAGADPFDVLIGVPGPGDNRLLDVQAVRIGRPTPFNVIVCSSAPTVGTINATACDDADIVPGDTRVGFNFNAGATTGATTVTATSEGAEASVRVLVRNVILRLTLPDALGEDLQDIASIHTNSPSAMNVTVTTTATTCIAAAQPGDVGSAMLPLTIPAGQHDLDFTLQAVAQGVCTVNVSAPGIDPDEDSLIIAATRLRIVRLGNTIGASDDEQPFYVEIGPRNDAVPTIDSNRDNARSIIKAQVLRAGAAARPIVVESMNIGAGKVGDPETHVFGATADSDIVALSSRTADFLFDPTDNVAEGSNQTTVRAYATPLPSRPSIDGTEVDVVVSLSALRITGPDFIGTGLFDTFTVRLGRPAASPSITVTVSVEPLSQCKVSDIGGTPAASATLTVVAGDRSAPFSLYGDPAADLGVACTVHVSAPTYYSNSQDIDLAGPALAIEHLDHTLSLNDDPAAFDVRTGALRPNTQHQFDPQTPQAPVTVYACVRAEDVGYAEILGGTEVLGDTRCQQATIPAGVDITSVFSLKPLAEKTVQVCASVPGAPEWSQDCEDVRIRTASVRITGPSQLGSSLQAQYKVHLGTAPAANRDVVICVIDTPPTGDEPCEVAQYEEQNGSNCTTVTVPAGDRDASFWLQGVEPRTGACDLSINAGSGYDQGTASFDIVTPGFDLSGLPSRHSPLDPDEDFEVNFGVPSSNLRQVHSAQELRFNTRSGATLTVPVVVCSNNSATAEVLGGVAYSHPTKQCRTTDVGQLASGTSEFSVDLKNPGNARICVESVNGYLPTDAACVDVNVDELNLRILPDAPIAVGLEGEMHVDLRQTTTTVPLTVDVLTTATCAIAEAGDPDSTTLTPSLPTGTRRYDFVVRGLAPGPCRLQAYAATYRSGEVEFDVTGAALEIAGLRSSLRVGQASNENFTTVIGVPSDNLRQVARELPLKYPGSGQLVEACSSAPTIAKVVGGSVHPDMASQANCRAALIAAGQSSTDAFSVQPMAESANPVEICVQCIDSNGQASPDCHVERSCRTVWVRQAGIQINLPERIGAGLEVEVSARLQTAAPAGGVVMRLETLTNARCVIASHLLDTGSDYRDVTVPAGKTRAQFVVQGVVGAAGECMVKATASGYAAGSETADIVTPALAIKGLPHTFGANSPNEDFSVQIAPPQLSGSCISGCQAVAVAGGWPINTCSNNTNAGVVEGGSAGPTTCRAATIAQGDCAFDNYSFNPAPITTPDSTTVYTTSPMYPVENVDCDSIDVEVRPSALRLSVPDEIGVDLQDEASVHLSTTPPNGTTISIVATGSCAVAALREGPPVATGTTLTLNVPNGRRDVGFYIQGLAPEGPCNIAASTTTAGYGPTDETFDIVVPAAVISQLPSSIALDSANRTFVVKIGPPLNLRNIRPIQEVRPHSTLYPLPLIGTEYGKCLKVCSSNSAVGKIAATSVSDTCRPGLIKQLQSQTTMFAFDDQGLGSTEVSVEDNGCSLQDVEDSHRSVDVVAKSITLGGRDAVGIDLQDEFPLQLSSTVASNAIFQVDVDPLGPDNCDVANAEAGAGSNTTQVTVPANRSRASLYIHGRAEGPCNLKITPPNGIGYVLTYTSIDVAKSGIHFVSLDTSLSTQSADVKFNVEIGVSRRPDDLLYRQPARTGSGGIPVTVCSSNYTTAASILGHTMGCKVVTIAERETRSANGALVLHPLGNNPTTISANAAGFVGTNKLVVVSALALSMRGGDVLGAGLEDSYTLQASAPLAADRDFIVSSGAPSLCKVSAIEAANGATSTTVRILKGRTRADFYVHGMEGVADTCQLHAYPQDLGIDITDAYLDIDIAQPAIRLSGLDSSIRTADPDDNFMVQTGLASSGQRNVNPVQKRRYNAPAQNVTVCSSVSGVAKIVTSNVAATCQTVPLPAFSDHTADSGTGALAIRGLTTGTTTVSAESLPDYISTTAAYKAVSVTQGTLKIDDNIDVIGSGLQDTLTVRISPKAPSPNLVVRVESTNTALCKVAPNELTAGMNSWDITVPKGHATMTFTVQAIEPNLGSCPIKVSTPFNSTYGGDEFEIMIGQPALRLRAVDPTTSSTEPLDSFFIDVGVAATNLRDLKRTQSVRAGASDLAVEACSSNTAVGVAVPDTADPNSNCEFAYIEAGEDSTDKDEIKFDALWVGPPDGYTTLSARGAYHFTTTTAGYVDIVVSSRTLAIESLTSDNVGSGLMALFEIHASASATAATVMTVTTSTPSVCQVAADETAAGGTTTQVTMNAGASTKKFAVHGNDGQTGPCILSVQGNTYSNGYGTVYIVQPSLRISGLGNSKSGASGPDAFIVESGVAKVGLDNLDDVQSVRIGSPGLAVTVCSDDGSVGVIQTSTTTAACVTATIAAGDKDTDAPASNDLYFLVGLPGTTTVSATTPGFQHIEVDDEDVTVSTSGYALNIVSSNTRPIGAGLQRNSFSVHREGGLPAGATVQVKSLTPTYCVVATSGSSLGTQTITLPIAAGASDTAAFWVQGLENVTGSCTLEATVPLVSIYGVDTETVSIVRSAIELSGVPTSILVTNPDLPFLVRLGVPNTGSSALDELQQVRGGVTGIDITVTSSNPAAAQLVGTNASNVEYRGGTVTVRILPGQSTNTGSGALEVLSLDPQAAAGTTVTASNPNLTATTAATVNVTVVASGGGC